LPGANSSDIRTSAAEVNEAIPQFLGQDGRSREAGRGDRRLRHHPARGALIEHDLVDELRLMMYPVVPGAGERLLGETSDMKPLRLVETRTVGDGVVIHTYEPVRDPGQGERPVPEAIGAEAE
jgi:RibD C-terminal domain